MKLSVDPFGATDYGAADHPSYRHRARLSAGFPSSLAGDLGQEV